MASQFPTTVRLRSAFFSKAVFAAVFSLLANSLFSQKISVRGAVGRGRASRSTSRRSAFYEARLQNTYKFGKSGWSAELNGSYQSQMVWGLFIIRELGQVTAGIQKNLKNKLTTLRLNVSNIFTTDHIAVLLDYQNMDFFTDRTWDSRVATFSLTHGFGKQTVQQARRRTSSVEDEKRRAG